MDVGELAIVVVTRRALLRARELVMLVHINACCGASGQALLL